MTQLVKPKSPPDRDLTRQGKYAEMGTQRRWTDNVRIWGWTDTETPAGLPHSATTLFTWRPGRIQPELDAAPSIGRESCSDSRRRLGCNVAIMSPSIIHCLVVLWHIIQFSRCWYVSSIHPFCSVVFSTVFSRFNKPNLSIASFSYPISHLLKLKFTKYPAIHTNCSWSNCTIWN